MTDIEKRIAREEMERLWCQTAKCPKCGALRWTNNYGMRASSGLIRAEFIDREMRYTSTCTVCGNVWQTDKVRERG